MHVGLMQKRPRASFGFVYPYSRPIRSGSFSHENYTILRGKVQYESMVIFMERIG